MLIRFISYHTFELKTHFDFVFYFYKLFILLTSGGWVQLISKKGRKNRKKDEATNIERQTCIVKPVQNIQINKSGKFSPH